MIDERNSILLMRAKVVVRKKLFKTISFLLLSLVILLLIENFYFDSQWVEWVIVAVIIACLIKGISIVIQIFNGGSSTVGVLKSLVSFGYTEDSIIGIDKELSDESYNIRIRIDDYDDILITKNYLIDWNKVGTRICSIMKINDITKIEKSLEWQSRSFTTTKTETIEISDDNSSMIFRWSSQNGKTSAINIIDILKRRNKEIIIIGDFETSLSTQRTGEKIGEWISNRME